MLFEDTVESHSELDAFAGKRMVVKRGYGFGAKAFVDLPGVYCRSGIYPSVKVFEGEYIIKGTEGQFSAMVKDDFLKTFSRRADL